MHNNDLSGLKPTLIATTTPNQTMALHLGEIYTAFNTLSDDNKKRAVVKIGNSWYRVTNLTQCAFSNVSLNSTQLYIDYYRADTSKWFESMNGTITDKSSNVSASSLELWVC